MADFTFSNTVAFPSGTTVNVYLRADWRAGQTPTNGSAPPGSVVTSESMGANDCTFTGLEDGTSYVAGAQVAGAWRYIHFSTPPTPDPAVLVATDVSDELAEPVEAYESFSTNVTLNGLPGVGDSTWAEPLGGEAVLLRGQTDPVENGVWVVSATDDWTRTEAHSDWSGATVLVLATGLLHRCTSESPATPGVDELTIDAGRSFWDYGDTRLITRKTADWGTPAQRVVALDKLVSVAGVRVTGPRLAGDTGPLLEWDQVNPDDADSVAQGFISAGSWDGVPAVLFRPPGDSGSTPGVSLAGLFYPDAGEGDFLQADAAGVFAPAISPGAFIDVIASFIRTGSTTPAATGLVVPGGQFENGERALIMAHLPWQSDNTGSGLAIQIDEADANSYNRYLAFTWNGTSLTAKSGEFGVGSSITLATACAAINTVYGSLIFLMFRADAYAPRDMTLSTAPTNPAATLTIKDAMLARMTPNAT